MLLLTLFLHVLIAPILARSPAIRFQAARISSPAIHSPGSILHPSHLSSSLQDHTLTLSSRAAASSTRALFGTPGVSGDPCVTRSDCRNGLPCIDFRPSNDDTRAFLCNPCIETCRCIDPFEEAPCTTDSDCPASEMCVKSQFLDSSFCIGRFAVATSPSLYPISDISGLTGETCTRNGHCRNGLKCNKPDPDNCPSNCQCLPSGGITTCSDNSDCQVPGEICLLEFNGPTIFAPICVSQSLIFSTKFEINNSASGDPCLRDEDCAEGLVCQNTPSDICLASGCNICRRPIRTKCKSNTQCADPREVCAKWRDTGKFDCVSKEAAMRGTLIKPPKCAPVPFNG